MNVRYFGLLFLSIIPSGAQLSLAPLPTGAASCSTKPHAWVAVLAPRLEANRGEFPLTLLLGWIEIESGGNIHSTTSLDERGYFQLMPAESKDLGLDHARLGLDPNYSLDAGVTLVRHYVDQTESLGYSQTDTDFWRIVKFQHSIGATAVAALLREMGTNHGGPWNWQDIEQFSVSNRLRLIRLIGHDPVKWTRNVDQVMESGAALSLEWKNRVCTVASSKTP